MKGTVVNILLAISIVYTCAAPFDKPQSLSAIEELKEKRNPREENLPSLNRERGASDHPQWFSRDSKHRDVKQSNRTYERPSVPLILPQTKSKSDRSGFKLDKVISYRRKNAEVKDSQEESLSSTEEQSDQANISEKWKNSNRRRKNRYEESSSEESDSSEPSSSDRSNSRYQKRRERNSRDGKRKRESQENDGDRRSSSSSSESDDDSDDEEFREYLKSLSEKEKNYKEIRYVLKHYRTDDYCKKLYEWNRDKYLVWKRKLELKKEILREKTNFKKDKLLRVCNISKNRDQDENEIRNCLRDCLSTNNKFNFTIKLIAINKLKTTNNEAGEESEGEKETESDSKSGTSNTQVTNKSGNTNTENPKKSASGSGDSNVRFTTRKTSSQSSSRTEPSEESGNQRTTAASTSKSETTVNDSPYSDNTVDQPNSSLDKNTASSSGKSNNQGSTDSEAGESITSGAQQTSSQSASQTEISEASSNNEGSIGSGASESGTSGTQKTSSQSVSQTGSSESSSNNEGSIGSGASESATSGAQQTTFQSSLQTEISGTSNSNEESTTSTSSSVNQLTTSQEATSFFRTEKSQIIQEQQTTEASVIPETGNAVDYSETSAHNEQINATSNESSRWRIEEKQTLTAVQAFTSSITGGEQTLWLETSSTKPESTDSNVSSDKDDIDRSTSSANTQTDSNDSSEYSILESGGMTSAASQTENSEAEQTIASNTSSNVDVTTDTNDVPNSSGKSTSSEQDDYSVSDVTDSEQTTAYSSQAKGSSVTDESQVTETSSRESEASGSESSTLNTQATSVFQTKNSGATEVERSTETPTSTTPTVDTLNITIIINNDTENAASVNSSADEFAGLELAIEELFLEPVAPVTDAPTTLSNKETSTTLQSAPATSSSSQIDESTASEAEASTSGSTLGNYDTSMSTSVSETDPSPDEPATQTESSINEANTTARKIGLQIFVTNADGTVSTYFIELGSDNINADILDIINGNRQAEPSINEPTTVGNVDVYNTIASMAVA